MVYVVKSNLYVISYSFAANKRYFWTAGTNFQRNKSNLWFTTAESFSYNNWKADQPDIINEHCVHISNYNNKGWNDLNCESKIFFICQKLVCP